MASGLTQLHQFIVAHYSLDELRMLCFELVAIYTFDLKSRWRWDMGKYGTAAVRAVILFRNREARTPREAWRKATAEVFRTTPKNCPECSFLGLCEEGLVKGIPPGDYTLSRKNKEYAIRAVQILVDDPVLADHRTRLWDEVVQGEWKKENEQMDVVISLWREGLLRT
jgi:hypothetical protein